MHDLLRLRHLAPLFLGMLLFLANGCDQTTGTTADTRRQNFNSEEAKAKPSVDKNAYSGDAIDIDDGESADSDEDGDDTELDDEEDPVLDLPASKLGWDGRSVAGSSTFQMIPID